MGLALALGVAAQAGAEDAGSGRHPDFDYDPPSPGSYELPVIKTAADAPLRDVSSAPVRLRELTGGHVTVLSFIYTRCGDARACPYASSVLNDLHQVTRGDPALARSLRLLSVSFDPAHDTPERMAAYGEAVRDAGGGCDWRFLTPRSLADLPGLLMAYNQSVNKATASQRAAGPLFHTLRVYLIDRERRIRNIYSSGTLDGRLLLSDIRTLLLEEVR